MIPYKLVFLFLLLAVVIQGNREYRNSHKRGVAFYGYDWDDQSVGGGMEDESPPPDEEEEEEEEGEEWVDGGEDDEWGKEEENGDEEEGGWENKDEENTDYGDKEDDGDDDDDDASHHYHHHYHHHHLHDKKPHIRPPPPPSPSHSYQKHKHHPHPLVKVDIITRARPHRGNFRDGYTNGFNAGMEAPFNRNHTIEYIHTVTSCGIHKRIDVIDGVSYTFSSLATVSGPITVTKTVVDFDGNRIELPLTGAEEQLATLPMDGVTRTVVAVENEATTLPLRTRRRRQRQPPSDQRQFLADVPNEVLLERLGLDEGSRGWGKVLAAGDDGIRGTVLRNINYDENGDPILPTRAGTRQVYIINDKTTTLKDGIPTPFPADNGHTRTVIALRNGMVTLPLTGADEFTKLLPIQGITETLAVFDNVTYTLSPDQTDSNGQVIHHNAVPSQIVRTVIVEEIVDGTSTTKPPTVATATAKPAEFTIQPPGPTQVPLPGELLAALAVPFTAAPSPATTNHDSTFPSASSSTRLIGLASPSFSAHIVARAVTNDDGHCPTKLVLDTKRASEGCFSLAGLQAVASDTWNVDTQGPWTDQGCHAHCEKSEAIQTSEASSWYYGLTMSISSESSNSTACRCMVDLAGSRPSTQCRLAPGSLQQRPYHLGIVQPQQDPSIYIYQANYRCLASSLLRRRRLEPPDTACRATQVESKAHSEGCYPYLAPKVSVRQTRQPSDEAWTPATCYSFCVASGRVPTRASWFYGVEDSTCLCMLTMGSKPTECDGASTIYAYEVSYTCPTCTQPTVIDDAKATEGCYDLADVAAHSVQRFTRDLAQGGVYSAEECFSLCKSSIKSSGAWWYGVTMSDPSSHGTTSCRCSIQPPSSSTTGSRCRHGVGLVDDRFLHRLFNGIYVYQVSYKC